MHDVAIRIFFLKGYRGLDSARARLAYPCVSQDYDRTNAKSVLLIIKEIM
jgi:hypothetical protein